MNNKQREISLSDEELLRYSRQILLSSWDIEAQLRLKASQVIVVGAGGLGCPVSETLARAGVGAIHMVDDDVIEASNLQRQTLFTAADIGQYKAQIAAQALSEINPFVSVCYSTQRLSQSKAEQVLNLACLKSRGSVGFKVLLLDCTDNFATRELLNRLSVSYQVPLLSASAIAMTGQLALYEPSKHTGCYHCVFGDTLSPSETTSSHQTTPQNTDNTQNCTNSGVLASTTTVMGNLQANAALQYLGLAHNPLQGQLLIWNANSMVQHKIRYRQDKQCPICGSGVNK